MNLTKKEKNFILTSISYFINNRIKNDYLDYTELINFRNKIRKED